MSKIQDDITKVQAIVFGKTLKKKPIIKLGTTILPVKENTRYLDVILDQKLNFSKHINIFLEKAKTQLNRILTQTEDITFIRESSKHITVLYF